MLWFLMILAVPVALALAGFVYQWVGSQVDRQRFAASGRMVEIERGLRLYLLEMGERGAGEPTVIFESGIAATNLNWHCVQESVAEFNHAVTYDRAGLGWSSRALTRRTPGNIALELHTMLQAAGIQPPYVLVGHSFGGLVMRKYTALYPDDVTGVVLVDPMRLEEWPPLDPTKQATLDRGVQMSELGIPFARVGLARLVVTSLLCGSGKLSDFMAKKTGEGGAHVLGRIKGEVGKMPRQVWPVVAAHWSRPAYYRGMGEHVSSVPDTVREMLDAKPIVGIPVTLLTPGASAPVSAAGMEQIGNIVEQVIARDSAHWIHLDEPEMVIEAIRAMVAQASVVQVAAVV